MSTRFLIILLLGLSNSGLSTKLVSGQVLMSDDFEDGNDDGWIHSTYSLPRNVPDNGGEWEVEDGSYTLSTPGPVPVRQLGLVASYWKPSNNPRFQNGFLRALVTANTPGTALGLVLRSEEAFYNSKNYTFNASDPGASFNLIRIVNETNFQTLQSIDQPFDAGESWWMEAGAVGDELTFKVWREGEPEPEAPQLRRRAPNIFSTGYFGLVAAISTGWGSPAMTSATFDNVSFRSAHPIGDFNLDFELDAQDLDALASGLNEPDADLDWYDLNDDGQLGQDDLTTWVHDIGNTWLGDANFDGEFNSVDFVQIFGAGLYETSEPANWSEGDWNGDRLFNSSDLVAAFADGGYEQGPRAATFAVPEPTAGGCLMATLTALIALSRGRLQK